MQHFEFYSPPEEKHQCIGHQKGDWIIFTCPECSYQRHFNWQTGEMRVFNETLQVAHSGFHAPVQPDVNASGAN